MKQGGKDKYTLSEFGELIDPVYRVYGEQIRRCISGLTGYAAQCAAARQEEQLPKLRERGPVDRPVEPDREITSPAWTV